MQINNFESIYNSAKPIYKFLSKPKVINYFYIVFVSFIILFFGLLLFCLFFNSKGYSNNTKFILCILWMVLFIFTFICFNIFVYFRKRAIKYFNKLFNFVDLYSNDLKKMELNELIIKNDDSKNNDKLNEMIKYSSIFNDYYYTKWHNQFCFYFCNKEINMLYWKAYSIIDNKKKINSHLLFDLNLMFNNELLISSQNINNNLNNLHNLFINDVYYVNNDLFDLLNEIKNNVGNFIFEIKNNKLSFFIDNTNNIFFLDEKNYNFWKTDKKELLIQYNTNLLMLNKIIKTLLNLQNN